MGGEICMNKEIRIKLRRRLRRRKFIKENDMEEVRVKRSVLTEKYAEESAQRACRTEALEERDA